MSLNIEFQHFINSSLQLLSREKGTGWIWKITIVLLFTTVLFLGIVAFKRNYVWKNEVILWTNVVKNNPDKARGHNNLGGAYEKLSRLQEAIEEYQKVIRLEPDAADAYNNRGSAYYKLGRVQEAIEEYQKAIRLEPDAADIHYNLGLAYYELGRVQEAIEEYQKAIRLRPDDMPAYINLGLAYEKLGRMDEARHVLDQLQGVTP